MSDLKIEITSNQARPHTIGAGSQNAKITLLPGRNVVSKKDWDAVKTLPVIKHYLDKKELEEGKTGDASLDDLSKLKFPDAMALVEATLDTKVLKRWAEQEKRPPIKKAIETKIATLTTNEKPAE